MVLSHLITNIVLLPYENKFELTQLIISYDSLASLNPTQYNAIYIYLAISRY